VFWSALILGFIGSFHCAGMCGPFAFILSADKSDGLHVIRKLLYNFGRIFSYILLGMLVGLVGESFYLIGIQQKASLLAGILLIIISFYQIFEKKELFNFVTSSVFLKKIKELFSSAIKNKSLSSKFYLGLVNGFLPCGLVYTALTASLSFSGMVSSVFYMLAFGLGTLPTMLSVTLGGQFISLQLRSKIIKSSVYVVLLLGVLFVLRGANLNIPFLSPYFVEKLEAINRQLMCF